MADWLQNGFILSAFIASIPPINLIGLLETPLSNRFN